MILLGSPLGRYIHPKSWPRPSGNLDFRESSTLADHIASRRGKGCDIANGKTGNPVYAMLAGTVYQRYTQPSHTPPQIGDGALILRIRHADKSNSGYAHLQSYAAGIVVGSVVKKGQLIGLSGVSGTTLPHLHCHYQTAAGTHLEVLGMLEQSHNLQFNPRVEGVRIRTAPGLAAPIWGSAGTAGIIHEGTKVAEQSSILHRRPLVSVVKDGYEWMPILVSTYDDALWTARPFIHFV